MKTWMVLLPIVFCCGTAAGDEPLVPWPDGIDETVRASIRRGARRLGFTSREMSHFSGRKHCLKSVDCLFADASRLPRETDRLAREMLTGGYEGALRSAFAILGVKMPDGGDESDPGPAPDIVPADEASQEIWDALPEEVHLGVGILVRASVAARPHLHRAFDWDAIARRVGDRNVGSLGRPSVYHYAAGPWVRSGARPGPSYAALESFQPAELARAAALFSAQVRSGIGHLCKLDKEADVPDFESCRLRTTIGTVRILGRGNNTYRGNDAIVIDLGGNDRYSGRIAVPRSKGAPVGILVDLTGNDIYDGRQTAASIACGLFGIGALFDLSGNDQYYCHDSGLGCAWHGIGLLVDTGGDDVYVGHQWCQGASHAGVGLLFDEQGNDRYTCQVESQGLGSTLGVGLLIDRRGDDRYHARDNEGGRAIAFPSAQTKAHEVSLVQGVGYGQRGDSGGRGSLAGGVGGLIDGDGDDYYYGGVFSQGIGFWWSLGMLVDFGGNDRYRGVYYAQGASVHFALGSLVDHAGNDLYNDRRVLGQVLGSGRDGAIGTFVDAAGDDVYSIPKKSAGEGDLNGIGLFCDQRGNDRYAAFGRAVLGAATFANPRGERIRKTMPTIGIFADLSGRDTYPSHMRPRDNTKWYHQTGPPAWGFGLDTEHQDGGGNAE